MLATTEISVPRPAVDTNGPLSVVLFSTQAKWHGGERQLSLLAEGLRSRGHDCTIVAKSDSEVANRLGENGFPIVTFTGRGRAPSTLWRLRRFLTQKQPDVVHFNDSHAITTGGLASFGLGIPARITSRRVDFRIRSPFRFQVLSDSVFCVSNAVRRACENVGIASSRLFVVHDGVDPQGLLPGDRDLFRAESQIELDRPVISCIAKLTDCKGHRYLLEAMREVVETIPNVLLVCAGDGNLRSALEEQTIELGLKRNVRFLGYRDDVSQILSASDLMVISSHTEGLCSSIIDAMLLGCPVVATAAGGIPDLVTPDGLKLGWLVRPRDPKSLAEGIIEALSDRPMRESRAETARDFAYAEFTHSKMIDRTIEGYRRVIKAQVGG